MINYFKQWKTDLHTKFSDINCGFKFVDNSAKSKCSKLQGKYAACIDDICKVLWSIGNQMTASAIKVAPYIHFNGGLVTKHGVSTRAQMAILSFRNSMTAST